MLLACGTGERFPGAAVVPTAPMIEAPAPRDPRSIIADPAEVSWAGETMSPRWDKPGMRLPGCVAYELPLSQVAAAIARAKARQVPGEVADVNALLRALGSPHVWPRVWTLETRGHDAEQVNEAWSSWASSGAPREPGAGERRCGTASVDAADGRTIVAAVVVDALADLAPVPLRARTGQWLRVEARLLAEAQHAELVVLDPETGPRAVPGALHGDSFRAVFSADRPGMWRLQLLVERGQGPRPALEAWVFVDREPDLAEATQAAPAPAATVDENAGLDVLRAGLSGLIDAARRQAGVPSLRRDTALDQLAQDHAAAMAMRGQTAHDVGDGPPAERLARARVVARRIGENVARAASVERAHRVLWDSPSHRGNIVDPSFDALGVGVVRAAGDVWVCELFADRRGVVSPRAAD